MIDIELVALQSRSIDPIQVQVNGVAVAPQREQETIGDHRCGVSEKHGLPAPPARLCISAKKIVCMRDWRGSGTIFLDPCNLRCDFCQN